MINPSRSWVGGIVDNPAEEIDPKFRSFAITIDCVAEFIMRAALCRINYKHRFGKTLAQLQGVRTTVRSLVGRTGQLS